MPFLMTRMARANFTETPFIPNWQPPETIDVYLDYCHLYACLGLYALRISLGLIPY
jgi:hypothetical protein